ncbi:MAG: hypothetical protein ACETVZ_07285 [Phycisphaerae bacterium]
MTRRKFIRKLIKAGSAIVLGASWPVRKVVPHKFVRAIPFKKYPGSLRPLQDISEPSKWSG